MRPYLPRLLIDWLADAPGTTLRAVDGTVVFVDISGFTKMSERLARKGRVGAEEVTDVIGSVFARLLSVAYGEGGGLIKFGGDALFLLFTGTDHPISGARAAAGMRQMLRSIGAIETTAGKVTLRMSVGLHSGTFHFFLVGESHRELIIAGPGATETVSMEGTATAGEILVSRETAACLACLPPQTLGKSKGDGVLLRSVPQALPAQWPAPQSSLEGVDLLSCIPVALRDHVLAGITTPEHRQVTVAFIHFDGTDELVRDVGAETVAYGLDELVRVVQTACEKHGVTFLGTDVDKDGGKIILVAGAPSSHGDDEERMLLTVRAIADADTEIRVRIGVNRGPVFSGDIGPPYRRTYTVMGDAVNLAARVMAKAEPGEVLVTEPVLEGSAVRFEAEALEPFMVKGKRHPVVAHRLGAILGSSRTDALADLKLVGRQRELDALREALRRTVDGRGALVEVTGDAGTGKSRLIQELRTNVGGDVAWHEVACEPYESSTPYFPFRPLLRALLGIPEGLSHEETVATFTARVAQACPELMPWLPLLAVPLDLEIPDTPECAALDERFRRERMEAAIGDLLVEFAGGPAVAVIEDAQWIDEASADLLEAIAARMDELALAVLVARRGGAPAGDQELAAGDRRLLVALEPLTPDESEAFIQDATEVHPLTPHAVEALVRRSGGNPRFLKAMLFEVIRSGGSVDQLPSSIEGVVMAQIDRLPPKERTRLRNLSVLGTSFGLEHAGRVLEEGDIAAHVAGGAFEGLIEADGRGGFHFRNGLVRDVAYESLPYRRRRELHARVGEAILVEAGEDTDDVAELLSAHFFFAQRYEEAWRFSRLAAEQAAEIYANVESRDFFRRALEAAGKLPNLGPGERSAAEEALGDVYMRLGEYREAGHAYHAARRRLEDDLVTQGELVVREVRVACMESRFPQALRMLTRGRKLLEGADGDRAAGLRAQMGATYAYVRWAQGHYRDTIRWCQAALAEGEAAGDLDAMATAYGFLAYAEVSLGRSHGDEDARKSLELYERMGNLAKQADVLNNMGNYAYFEGKWDEAVDLYERARQLFERTGNVVDAAVENANLGEILLQQGRLDEAEAQLRKALRLFRASGSRAVEVFALTLLGAIAARSGRFDEAAAVLEEVQRTSREVGDASHISDVAAMSAESLVLQGDPQAVAVTDGLLSELAATDPVGPSLWRSNGYAHMQAGDREAAQLAFQTSLDRARERDAIHDVAFTLDALLRCGLGDGRPEADIVRERDELFARLRIVAVPDVPLPASV